MESFPRPKNRRRERGLVGRIGKMLSLQAETIAMLVSLSSLADVASIQEVACVKLHTGLGSQNFQDPARGRLVYPSSQSKFPCLSIKDKIVVVSSASLDLVVLCIYALSNPVRLCEV